jgi:hypothetical protein
LLKITFDVEDARLKSKKQAAATTANSKSNAESKSTAPA